jgi:hypothetical protein
VVDGPKPSWSIGASWPGIEVPTGINAQAMSSCAVRGMPNQAHELAGFFYLNCAFARFTLLVSLSLCSTRSLNPTHGHLASLCWVLSASLTGDFKSDILCDSQPFTALLRVPGGVCGNMPFPCPASHLYVQETISISSMPFLQHGELVLLPLF